MPKKNNSNEDSKKINASRSSLVIETPEEDDNFSFAAFSNSLKGWSEADDLFPSAEDPFLELGIEFYEKGLNFLESKDGAQDRSQGIAYMQLAADAGNDQAQLALFLIYIESGTESLLTQDYAQSCLKKAAEKNVEAMTRLAFCYEHSIHGFLRDERQAFHFYHQAASQHHAPAIYHLGRCFWWGIGTKRDPEQSRDWMSMAAGLGDDQAKQFLLELDEKKKQIEFSTPQDCRSFSMKSNQEKLNIRLVEQMVTVLTLKFIHHLLGKENISLMKTVFSRTEGYRHRLTQDILNFFEAPESPSLTPATLRSLAKFIASREPLVSHRQTLQSIYGLWRKEESSKAELRSSNLGISDPPMILRTGFY